MSCFAMCLPAWILYQIIYVVNHHSIQPNIAGAATQYSTFLLFDENTITHHNVHRKVLLLKYYIIVLPKLIQKVSSSASKDI